MTSDELKERFYTVLSAVPAGKVITYGQLAAQAGMPRNARWAGYLLRNLPSTTQLPWHRVVNAQGNVSFPAVSEVSLRQIERLAYEAVEFNVFGIIDLKRFG